MATFDRGWKVAMKLPGSAVWEPKPPVCWKPAMKLPRSAVWGHSAENRPWNCQGRQFENINLVMDRANGWKAAMKLPRSAVWGPKGPKCWKLAMKLPRSAVWVHKKKCGSNCRPWQFYGHFFKLPDMAGLPKCYGSLWHKGHNVNGESNGLAQMEGVGSTLVCCHQFWRRTGN